MIYGRNAEWTCPPPALIYHPPPPFLSRLRRESPHYTPLGGTFAYNGLMPCGMHYLPTPSFPIPLSHILAHRPSFAFAGNILPLHTFWGGFACSGWIYGKYAQSTCPPPALIYPRIVHLVGGGGSSNGHFWSWKVLRGIEGGGRGPPPLPPPLSISNKDLFFYIK